MGTKIYTWLLIKVIPFIRTSTYYTDIRGDKYHDGYKYLTPGDIILTVDRRKLTSLLVPGTMTHAAVCVHKRTSPTIATYFTSDHEIREMTHTDYTKSDFFDICKEADRVVIMRCQTHTWGYNEAFIAAVNSLDHAKYDTTFTLGVEALYCSELVYQADQIAAKRLNCKPMLDLDLTDIHSLGTKYISPDGLMFSPNCVCVWDSDYKFTGLTGRQIEDGRV